MGLFSFPQVDSNVNVIFSVDGDEYAVEQFKIGFHQPVDGIKNQPEGEVMKLRQAGYLIVYNPYAELYHYESKSRGLEDTPEKVARFNQEIATFEKRWPDILKNGDPFYNPNLTLDSQDFSLKRL